MQDSRGREKAVVFLMGPTASGKTDLAVKLCEQFPFEIVSVDSAMVYRGMDIGTAKPEPEILSKAPHRLIDICDPSESYSAGQFRRDALQEINDIQAAGKIPLLTGGTGLYFRSLEQGIASLPQANPEIREEINSQAEKTSWTNLHKELMQIDPESGARIHPNDPQRIQRALEVFRISGRTLSSFFRDDNDAGFPFQLCKIALLPSDRAQLHQRIEHRFERMMEFGLLDEVESLYQRGDLSLNLPSIRMVGYRQVWLHLQGKLSREEMREKAIVATRQLAKRQMTWIRSEREIEEFDCLEAEIEGKVLNFVQDTLIL